MVRHKVLLLSVGDVAPESGPNRMHYLRKNGESFLSDAETALQEVVQTLDGFPVPVVRLTGDEEHDHAYLGAVVGRWAEIREELGASVIESIREPLEFAVANAVDALNFLEDTELQVAAHDLLHKAAWLRFGFLGCKLWLQEGSIYSNCPIRIAHRRWGFSPELKTRWICSICRNRFDSDECIHVPGAQYDVLVDRTGANCTACLASKCNHVHGETVLVLAQQEASDVEATAVALVARPRDPRARIVTLTLSAPEGTDLHNQVETGDAVCTECILPCTGFIELEGLS